MRKSMIAMAVVLGCCGMMCVNAAPAAAKPEGKTITKELDWCTVVMPEKAKIGETIKVKVTLKKAAMPNMLSCGMHCQLKGADPFPGLFWIYTPPQEVTKADGTYTFEFTLTANENEKGEAAGAIPVLYLSKDGAYENKTIDGTCEPIPVSK